MEPMAAYGMPSSSSSSPSSFPQAFFLHLSSPHDLDHHPFHHHVGLATPPATPATPPANPFADFTAGQSLYSQLNSVSMAPLLGDGGAGSNIETEAACSEDEEEDDDGAPSAGHGMGGGGGGGGGGLIGEKKRRLSAEQVRALERNFELGNKLEPERKLQLARALALQPRQVAIWFQNRRARWKTKQLEKDYDALRRQLDTLRAENDALQSHNRTLRSELQALKNGVSGGGGGRDASDHQSPAMEFNLNKETDQAASCSTTEHSSDGANPPDAPSAIDSAPPAPPPPPFYSASSLRLADFEQLLHAPAGKIADGAFAGGGLLCTAAADEQPPFWPWADHHSFH